MDRTALLERFYFFEVERKSKMQSALSLPIGVLALTGAGGSYGFDLLKSEGWVQGVAIILYIGALSLFAWAVFEVGVFLVARKYKFIWCAGEFQSHYEELVEFVRSNPDAESADRTFERQFFQDLASCTDHNTKVNDNRAAGLWRLNVATYGIVVLFLLLSLLAVSQRLTNEEYDVGRQAISTASTDSATSPAAGARA